VFVDERKRTCGCEDMLESIACFGLHIRHPRVHVPALDIQKKIRELDPNEGLDK
jgi:hypothetical protein